jgi:catalase
VSYEPNSLGGGCPFQAGRGGLRVVSRRWTTARADKVRGKPEKFADHYTQATLFYESQTVAATQAALLAAGAQVHLVAPRLGPVKAGKGKPLEASSTFENSPPVLFDGVVLPDGADGVHALGSQVEVMDFISNQYRHGKTLLAIGASCALLERGGVRSKLPSGEADPGIVLGTEGKAANAVADFITALGKHRHPERETGAMLK